MSQKFEIHMNLDGDAFAQNTGAEAARILRELADKIDERGLEYDSALGSKFPRLFRLKDFNGNRVGYAALQEEE